MSEVDIVRVAVALTAMDMDVKDNPPPLTNACWHKRAMTGFDLETTCVNPEQARIVGAAIVGVGQSVNGQADWLVNPGVPIDPGATAVHGITDAEVQAHGVDPFIVIPLLRDCLYEAWDAGEAVVIYNAPFDLTVLDRELKRRGFGPLEVRGLVIDPFVLDKIIDPFRRGGRKLVDVARHWGADDVPAGEAHGARRDTLAALRTAWKIADRYPAQIGRLDTERLMTWQRYAKMHQSHSLWEYFVREGRLVEAAGVRGDWPIWEDRTVKRPEVESGRCEHDVCRKGHDAEGCGWCGECSPEVPEWTT